MSRRRDVERPSVVRKALEAREQMEEHLTNPAYLGTVVLDFVDQMSGMFRPAGTPDGAIVMLSRQQRLDNVAHLTNKWRGSIRVGEVYAVTPDMHYLVEQAAADLPDDYTAEHHHLHAEHGFLWLPERIVEPTQDGVDMPPTDLLTWHNGTGWSTRVNDGRGGSAAGIEVNLWARTNDGTIVPVGSDFLPYGWPALGWRSYGFDGVREVKAPEQRLSNSTRYVLALQMLMRQELPALNRFPVPRADLRHLRRIQMPESDVTVISLRRRSYKDRSDVDTDGHRVLTRRHLVRGHWHSYWVGPSHEQHPGDTEEKVRIHKYVNAYVKGPEDAEWAVTPQRIHVVRR